MARPRARIVDYVVYLLVRTTMCFVRAVPWAWALSLGRTVAWVLYHVDRRHRLIAADNLRHAFPERDEAEIDRLVRATYEHFVTVTIEFIRLPGALRTDNCRELTHWVPGDGEERAMRWVRSGRPVMVLTGHVGNWEVLGYTIGLVGVHAGVVARKLDNPYLDRLLRELREKTGQTLLDKNEDYPRIVAMLERGEFIAMVGDQDAGSRGLYVDFLGRPASSFKSIALLSLQFDAPILVLAAVRVGHPLRYRLYFEEVILPEEHATDRDAVRSITQRYAHALERVVRRHPEQYFWLHRRWKHQPKAKVARVA